MPDVNYNGSEATIKDYLNLIRANIVPIIIITLVGLGIAIFYAFTSINIYRSTTSLKLNKPQGNILEAPLVPEFQDFGSDRFVANEIEVLKSYTLRKNVANTLVDSFAAANDDDKFYLILNRKDAEEAGIEPYIYPIRSITGILGQQVSIEQRRGLDFVEISALSPSPFESALIANSYAKEYRKLNLKYNRQQLISVKDFLETQREEKLEELIKAEENLKEYQEEGGIIALDQQASALIELLSDFDAKRDAAKIDVTIAKQSLEEYKKELAEKDPQLKDYLESVSTEPYLTRIREQIAELQANRDLALLTSTSGQQEVNQQIIDEYDKKIKELQGKLDDRIESYKSGLYASSPEEIRELAKNVIEYEIQYQAHQASYEELSNIVDKYESRLNKLPERTIDLARLNRELSAYEKLYLLVEERYQEALINEQSTPGNVLIVDEARVPLTPYKPNRILIIAIGFIMGLVVGVVFVFVRDYFDNTIKTPEDIQKRNINVLAWIPQIEGVSDNKEFEFIFAKKPDSIPSEAFRALRTRIQFSRLDKKNQRTILITSSTPKEGKTTVSVNLAGSFANSDKKTILIDCDLRKPRMHNLFNTKRVPGLTDYFLGEVTFDEIVKTYTIEKTQKTLHYITAGTIPPNPSEILGSQQMHDFLEKLKETYDYVIVDSPPVIAVTDSEILSRMVDSTILVASADQTEVDLIEKSVQLLTHENKSFAGVLLNNFSYKSGYGSYYKYYYYYSRPTNGNNKSRKDKARV